MANSLVFNPFTGNFDVISTVAVTAVGSTPNADGLSISASQVLNLEPADGTHPGALTAGTQTIGGAKTFINPLSISGSSDAVQLSIMGNSSQTNNVIQVLSSGFASLLSLNNSGDLSIGNNADITGRVQANYYLGPSASPSASGVYRLSNTEAIGWRNNLDSGDKTILLDTSDIFQFDSAIHSSGNITGANLSGTNTGDVTLGTASGLSLVGQVLSLALASTSTTGALSNTDWNTFNNKQAAGNYITALTSDVTASGPGSAVATIANNVVTDAKIRQSAALSLVGRSANSIGNVADIVAASDNQVLRRSGTSIGFGALDLSQVNTVGSSILPIANGGTNAATATAAFGNLSPLSVKGDLLSYTSSNVRHGVPGDYGFLVPDAAQSDGWRNATYKQLNGRPSKNYIQYADFENNATTGWSLGTVTLTSALPTGVPTFGSGASGNLSIATTSSSPLAGTYSLSYVSSAASTAGNLLASSAITIDAEDQAKVLSFKFYYSIPSNPGNGNFSGTSSNSFGIAIYDVTNSAWIIPAGVWSMVQSSGAGVASGTFQTPSNMTQFRLVMYNANATAGAITLSLDDFYCGPQISPLSPAMSDWVAYTPTFSAGFGTTSQASCFYRRVGDSLQAQIFFRAGTVTTGVGTISLPSGLNIDTAKIVNFGATNTCPAVGEMHTSGGTNQSFPLLAAVSTLTNVVYMGEQYDNASTITPADNVSSYLNTNAFIGAFFTVPIAGWSSNSVSSADTDTRVIAAEYYASTSQSLSGAQQINFDTAIYDTAGAVTTGSSAWKFTAPVTGKYRVSTTLTSNDTNSAKLRLYKNGSVAIGPLVTAPGVSNTSFSASTTISLVAGDYIDLRFNATQALRGDVPTGTDSSMISIERLSGPAVVQASESVNARYFASGTSISGSLATISWTTKDYDSHAGMSSGTYTVPVTGKYQVNAALALSGTFALNNVSIIEIQKNGSVVSRVKNYAAAAVTQTPLEISDEISCNAGDTIRIQVSSGATGPAIVSSNFENYISLFRTGN